MYGQERNGQASAVRPPQEGRSGGPLGAGKPAGTNETASWYT
jgi:hypothetical protein